MKKYIVFLIAIFSYLGGFSQIEFEKGYFIANNGNRTDCFIKNLDWKNNPEKFRYKLSEEGEIETATIDETSEFGVGEFRYIRTLVKLDRSSDKDRKLENGKYPKFKDETIFLKQLVKGSANLYHYAEGSLHRFFFNISGSPIEPLVYKRYLIQDKHIAKNEEYKNQLKEALTCSNISERQIDNLSYLKKNLTSLFFAYNLCMIPSSETIEKSRKRKSFRLGARIGGNYSNTLVSERRAAVGDVQFPAKAGLRIGLELEYILPFNKDKWAILVESFPQSYSASTELDTATANLDYKSIEILFGLRHYFYLNQKSTIFLTGTITRDLLYNSAIDLGVPWPIYMRTGTNYSLGLGYSYDHKYSIEIKRNFNRRLLAGEPYYLAHFRSISLILGYNFF